MAYYKTPFEAPPPGPIHGAVEPGPSLLAQAGMGLGSRGAWQHGDGLVFLDCDRPTIAMNGGEPAAPTGLFQFVIQSGTHALRAESVAADDRWTRSFGALQTLLPDEGLSTLGVPTRTLLVAMTPEHLHERIADQAFLPLTDRRGRTCMSNFSVTLLANAHDEAVDLGLSGQQLYFEDLRMAIENRLITLYLRCILGVEQAPETMAPTRVRRVLEFIEDNLSGTLALSELSEVAGLSKFHFSRAFRQTLGTTPHAFVMSRRLSRALELLRKRQPVGKIAALCGFSDIAHLSRYFKRAFGMQPSAFA
jgi:AraC family transcriptional regulator